jgi:hypothetical protein
VLLARAPWDLPTKEIHFIVFNPIEKHELQDLVFCARSKAILEDQHHYFVPMASENERMTVTAVSAL